MTEINVHYNVNPYNNTNDLWAQFTTDTPYWIVHINLSVGTRILIHVGERQLIRKIRSVTPQINGDLFLEVRPE